MDDNVFENTNEFERGTPESPSLLSGGVPNRKSKDRSQFFARRDDSKEEDSGEDSATEE